jgi:hypothetical protein
MRSVELLAGEKLVWKGAPEPGMKFRTSDIFITFFGLFFFGFSVFWMFMTWEMETPIYFTLFGTPFVLVGAYLVVGRFFWEAYRRGRTDYTLTDRRAIIRVDAFGRSQKTVTLQDLDEVMLEERNDGLGTIVFGRDITTGSGDDRHTSRAPRFDFIKDAARVYQMVEKARSKE